MAFSFWGLHEFWGFIDPGIFRRDDYVGVDPVGLAMVLYGVIGHIAGRVGPLHFCHAQLIQYSTCILGHVLGEGGHHQWALLT